jgi:hypothetical protein
MSQMQANTAIRSLEKAEAHRKAMENYARNYVEKLRAARAQYAGTDADSAGRLRNVGGAEQVRMLRMAASVVVAAVVATGCTANLVAKGVRFGDDRVQLSEMTNTFWPPATVAAGDCIPGLPQRAGITCAATAGSLPTDLSRHSARQRTIGDSANTRRYIVYHPVGSGVPFRHTHGDEAPNDNRGGPVAVPSIPIRNPSCRFSAVT